MTTHIVAVAHTVVRWGGGGERWWVNTPLTSHVVLSQTLLLSFVCKVT